MPIQRQAGSWSRPLGPCATGLILGMLAFPAGSVRAQEAADPGTSASGLGVLADDSTTSTTWGPTRPGRGARPGLASFFEVAYASNFGPDDQEPWRPLRLRTFFSDGWDVPWIAQPDTSGDAQQGWIDAADGSFYRLWFLSYNFTRSLSQGGNGNTGAYTIYTPLSRRLELITTVPFVTSQPTLNLGRQVIPNQGATSPAAGRRTGAGFGDLTFTPRVLLIEEDDYSFIAQVAIQTPTGSRDVGAGQAILSPGLQFWANVAKGWVVRGGFNANVGTNRAAGGTSLLSQLAVGRVLTPHDTPLVGDFTIYLSGNVLNKLTASETTVVLTPGFRTHLGKDWFLLGGIEVPVTGPRPFAEGVTFWIMKAF